MQVLLRCFFSPSDSTDFSSTHLETKSEGCFLKGKFVFYVMGPAYYSSSLDIYLAGPLELFAGYFACGLGGVWGWLPGCGSGKCPSWCAVNSPRFLALGFEHSGGTEWTEREEWDW